MSIIKKINGISVPNTFVSGFTYNDANLLTISQNGRTDLNVYLNIFSGLTINGIISATTYYGDGSNLIGISSSDNYVTGGTYSNGVLTLERQNGSVTVSGFTDYYVTGLTYNNQNKITLSQNGQQDLNIYLNQFSGISINGLSLPNGYALSVTGDTNFIGDVYVDGDLTYNGNLLVTGGTIIQNGLTANTIYTDYIDFNTVASATTQFGRINWDSGTGTLNIGIGDSTTGLVDFQVGQEEVVRVYNGEATTLQKGEIVYVSGSQGNRPKVKRASAISDGYSVTTLGMVDVAISSGSEGYVTTFGIISNLNTLGLTGGTPIWLSPTTPGAYTSTKPKAPQHTVLIGYVVRIHAIVGSIFVNISNGWELDEIHDVRINGVTDGDLLIRSSYSGTPVWVNSKTLNGNYIISGDTTNLGSFSATTFYGSGAGLNSIPIAGVTNLQSSLDLKTDLSLFTSHTGNTNNPHQTSFYQLISTAHTHTIPDVINLQSNLDLKTNLTDFVSHTANTNNPHQTSFYQLISTAHTHSISDIIDLQTNLNLKFDKSGGTVNGDVLVLGNVTILGSATTINTQTLSVADTVVTLNSNLTGGTPYPGHSGIEVLRGSGTTAALLWEEQRLQWEAGLHGGPTKRIILQGDSLALLTSGHTHPISEINGLQTTLDDKLSKTNGGTVVGFTSFNSGLSAYTMSVDDLIIPFKSIGVFDPNDPPTFPVGQITIGGYFESLSGSNRYSLQLKDGTEGVNKVLISKTSDGKTNWSNTLSLSSVSATTYYGNFAYVSNIIATNSFSSSTYSTNVGNTQIVFSNNGSLSGTTNLTWFNSVLNINGDLKSNKISGTTLVITSQPTSGVTSTQILMRNSTTGEVEITDNTSPNIFNYGLANAMINFNFLT